MLRKTLSCLFVVAMCGAMSMNVAEAGNKFSFGSKSSSRGGSSSMSRNFGSSMKSHSTQRPSLKQPTRQANRTPSINRNVRTPLTSQSPSKFSSGMKSLSGNRMNFTPQQTPNVTRLRTTPSRTGLVKKTPQLRGKFPKNPIQQGIGKGKGIGNSVLRPRQEIGKVGGIVRPRPDIGKVGGIVKPRPGIGKDILRPRPDIGKIGGIVRPPKIQKPLDPGFNRDRHHFGGHNHRPHLPGWCLERPHFNHCHWWFDICTPIRSCQPVDIVHCDWNYVHCDANIGGTIILDARWYLGMKGMFLPSKGLGIESVAPNSPADFAGLTPGMVILEVNGIPMIDETAMGRVIAESRGVLNMILMMEGDELQYEATVEMVQLVVESF